jgi:hypothetical protein
VIGESYSPDDQYHRDARARRTHLAHEETGVCPADSECPIRAEHGFFLGEPADIPQKQTLDNTRSVWCW